MGSAKVLAVAAAAAFVSIQAAGAADLPPLMAPMPAPVMDFGGWYLRGDIGMTNQKLRSFHNIEMDPPTIYAINDPGGFDSGMLFGLGVGYQFNSWLRADLTGEYRGKTAFSAMDRYFAANCPTVGAGTGWCTDRYSGAKSEWVGLTNIYADLGTWWSVTPFVGAGVGFAYNTFHNYHDMNSNGGGGYAADASKWNLAWALHAGLAYRVVPNFTVELAYRYISLGDVMSGDVIRNDGVNTINNPTTFHGLTSHDIKLGVRWMLGEPDMVMPPPLMRKG